MLAKKKSLKQPENVKSILKKEGKVPKQKMAQFQIEKNATDSFIKNQLKNPAKDMKIQQIQQEMEKLNEKYQKVNDDFETEKEGVKKS